jgi:hypothetical protein
MSIRLRLDQSAADWSYFTRFTSVWIQTACKEEVRVRVKYNALLSGIFPNYRFYQVIKLSADYRLSANVFLVLFSHPAHSPTLLAYIRY